MLLEIKKPTRLTVELSGGMVTIERFGKMNIVQHNNQQFKSFPIKSITSVELKVPSTFSPGILRFSLQGERVVYIAKADPKTIQFTKKDYLAISKLKNQIELLQRQGE